MKTSYNELGSEHLTILKNDAGYENFCKNGVDGLSSIGICYSRICSIINSNEYRKFEKSGKKSKQNIFIKNRRECVSMIDIIRYKKLLSNRTNMTIMPSINYPYFYTIPIKPLLKWPGGKSSDLKHIREEYSDLLPEKIKDYYEPFAGGMAVGLMLNVERSFINDLCPELIHFYKSIGEENAQFYNIITSITNTWDELTLISKEYSDKIYHMGDDDLKIFFNPIRNRLEKKIFAPEYVKKLIPILEHSLISKMKNIRRAEKKRGKNLPIDDILSNIEGALKAGFYTFVRYVYNSCSELNPLKTVSFYFLREYCFSSMFRYNAGGKFNVPYGGISYNIKSPSSRVIQWKDEKLISHFNRTYFDCMDFMEFLTKHKPSKGDFMFIDPPYDSEFSTYAKNPFGKDDQKRLAKYLIYECKSNFMAIMKATPFIRELYENKHPDIKCKYFDKNYSVSFMDRNDREVQHVIITRNV